jgi:hypothetical protein
MSKTRILLLGMVNIRRFDKKSGFAFHWLEGRKGWKRESGKSSVMKDIGSCMIVTMSQYSIGLRAEESELPIRGFCCTSHVYLLCTGSLCRC